MRVRTLIFAAAVLLATAAQAQIPASIAAAIASTLRPATDTEHDAVRKPALILDLTQIKQGSRVVDLLPGHGYFTRLSAVAVKPLGGVIAIVAPEARRRCRDDCSARR